MTRNLAAITNRNRKRRFRQLNEGSEVEFKLKETVAVPIAQADKGGCRDDMLKIKYRYDIAQMVKLRKHGCEKLVL